MNFTAPPQSGASATFPGGGAATTNASGVASITPTANGILGSYNVTAVVGALTATFALTNTPGYTDERRGNGHHTDVGLDHLERNGRRNVRSAPCRGR